MGYTKMKNKFNLSDEEKEVLNLCINENDCEKFVRKYINFIYYIVMTFKSSIKDHEIEELVNDIFLRLLNNNCEKLRKYDPAKGLSLSSWINLIGRQTIINFLRKNNIRNNFVSYDNEKIIYELNEHVDQEDHRLCYVEEIIETLPHRYKLFFKLFYYKNKELTEIADFMNISMDNVYSLKYKAIKKLKKNMKKKKHLFNKQSIKN